MSVQHANRGIVKKDLQLYYNREFQKSFRGEATINLLTRTTTFDSGTWQGYCGVTTNVTANTIDTVDPFGKYNALKVVRNGINTCYGAGAVAMGLLWSGPAVLVAGQTYTMSFYAKGGAGGETLRFGLNDTHAGGYYITLTTSWVRYSITFTNITDTSRGFQFISDTAVTPQTYYIAAPQLEQKSYATPYSDTAENINVRNITTTNLLTSTYSSLPTNWNVDGSGQATIGTYSYIENNTAIRVVDVNSNTRLNVDQLAVVSASTTYTFSVKYRKVSGTPTLRFQIAWYNSSNAFVGSASFPTTPQINIYDINGWQLAWYTVTSPASTAKVLWFIQDGNDYTTYNHTYDLKEPQIQTGTVPTAWTSNTATSNTLTSGGGLLDISGNNVNADLTNVLFNGNGYYFNAASSTRIIAKTYTATDTFWRNLGAISIWFKTSTNQNGTLVGWGDNGNTNFGSIEITADWTGGFADESLIAESYNATASQRAVIRKGANYYANGIWNNVTAVFDDNYLNLMIYINGVLETTSNNGNSSGAPFLNVSTSTSYFNIGRRTVGGGDEYFTGEIGQVLVYGKILTAAEVSQNFNATRKTYGI